MSNKKQPDYLARMIFEAVKLNPDTILKSLDDQGRYWITNDGQVLSVCRSLPLWKARIDNGNGYLYTEINGKKYYIHRLVAEAFAEDEEKKKNFSQKEVHHIDVNKKNNNIVNLCILTPEEHREIHRLLKQEIEENGSSQLENNKS